MTDGMDPRTRNSTAIDTMAALAAALLVVAGGLPALLPGSEPLRIAGAAIGLLGAALVAFLRGIAQRETVPAEDVLEVVSTDGEHVLAGPAADLATPGDQVRPYGSSAAGKYAATE